MCNQEAKRMAASPQAAVPPPSASSDYARFPPDLECGPAQAASSPTTTAALPTSSPSTASMSSGPGVGASFSHDLESLNRWSSWHDVTGSMGHIRRHFLDPRRAVHRYFVFALACCFIPGPYFHDTVLSAYKRQICAPEYLDINSTTFSLLFGLPSAMGAFSGPMASVIARWGDARSSFISGGLTFFASVGVVIALEHSLFWPLLFFRLLFWLGLYLLMAVQMVVVYKLFTGPELTVAMGFIIFACRSGGMLGFMSASALLNMFGSVTGALWFSVVLVGAAALSATIFACLRGGTMTARTVMPLLATRNNRPNPGGSFGSDTSASGGLWAESKTFGVSTWFVILQIALLYASIFPFETIETDFYESNWKISIHVVGWYTSLGTLFGLFAWAWGICVTTTAQLLKVTCACWGLLLMSFLILIRQTSDQKGYAVLGVTFFGIAYSYLSTASWILIPSSFGDGEDYSTSAVSCAYVAMSISMLCSNFSAGFLHDLVGYTGTCWWFILLALLGLLSALRLRRDFPVDCGADYNNPVNMRIQESSAPGIGENRAGMSEVEVAMHPSFMASTIAAQAAAMLEDDVPATSPAAATQAAAPARPNSSSFGAFRQGSAVSHEVWPIAEQDTPDGEVQRAAEYFGRSRSRTHSGNEQDDAFVAGCHQLSASPTSSPSASPTTDLVAAGTSATPASASAPKSTNLDTDGLHAQPENAGARLGPMDNGGNETSSGDDIMAH